MIDFHVIHHPLYQRDVVDFFHPQVNIHHVDGFPYHIGKGRSLGFQQGDAPYVSFFDDDGDKVNVECIDEILNRFNSDPTIDCIFTNEIQNNKGKITKYDSPLIDRQTLTITDVRHMHHIVVIKRNIIAKYHRLLQQSNAWPEFTLYGQMVLDGCNIQYFDTIGYQWMIHNQNAKYLKIKPSLYSINMVRKTMGVNVMLTQAQYDKL